MAKIKVLFLAASPDVAPLQLEDDLQQALLEHKPHILHFSGHGGQSEEIIS